MPSRSAAATTGPRRDDDAGCACRTRASRGWFVRRSGDREAREAAAAPPVSQGLETVPGTQRDPCAPPPPVLDDGPQRTGTALTHRIPVPGTASASPASG